MVGSFHVTVWSVGDWFWLNQAGVIALMQLTCRTSQSVFMSGTHLTCLNSFPCIYKTAWIQAISHPQLSFLAIGQKTAWYSALKLFEWSHSATWIRTLYHNLFIICYALMVMCSALRLILNSYFHCWSICPLFSHELIGYSINIWKNVKYDIFKCLFCP